MQGAALEPSLVRFEEPEVTFLPKGPGYYALTRHADVIEASRRPEDFCAGRGARPTSR